MVRISKRSAVNHPAVMHHYSLGDFKADNPFVPETRCLRQYRASIIEHPLPRRRRRLRDRLDDPMRHRRAE